MAESEGRSGLLPCRGGPIIPKDTSTGHRQAPRTDADSCSRQGSGRCKVRCAMEGRCILLRAHGVSPGRRQAGGAETDRTGASRVAGRPARDGKQCTAPDHCGSRDLPRLRRWRSPEKGGRQAGRQAGKQARRGSAGAAQGVHRCGSNGTAAHGKMAKCSGAEIRVEIEGC